jgi:TPR repeat protein
MGYHYLSGIGVTAAAASAARWFRLAAQQGYAPAITIWLWVPETDLRDPQPVPGHCLLGS